MAMKLRNKTSSEVTLDDLNGISVPANSDLDFDSGINAEISFSENLSTAIQADTIVIVNSDGVELSQADSLQVIDKGYDVTTADQGLGNPETDGQFLSSLIDGTRSWIDLQADLDLKENYLNNPGFDGQVLSSTNIGVRSWITVSLTDENAVWGNITGTLANQTDLDNRFIALETGKQDDLGIGTSGQILATNATVNGTEWIDNSVTWGVISGTLSNQTDLQNILDLKVNLTDSINVLSDVDTTGVLDPNDSLVWNGTTWSQNNTFGSHISNTLNPHNVTQSQVGLGNVDNTSDINKPISLLQQNEFDTKENGLGNPTLNGDVLISTTGGVRSWTTLVNTDVSAVWGNITGTLSSQTDLVNEFLLKADLTGAIFTGDINIVSGSGAKLNIETTVSGGQPQLHLSDSNAVPRAVFGVDTTTGDAGITRLDNAGVVEGTIRLDTLGNVRLLAGPTETSPIMTDDTHLTNKLYVDDGLNLKEDDLGLPLGSNYLLISDTSGVRSWIDAGSIGVTSVNGLIGTVILNTDDINEGFINLYYTDIRSDARVQFAIQDTVSSNTTLYSSAKIDALVAGALNYLGAWDANLNVPTLSNVTGTINDYYKVSVTGSQDLGAGLIDYRVGDDVIHNGTIWESFSSTDAIQSVNGKTGTVVLDTDDINEGITNLYYTNARVDARLVNIIDDNVTVLNLTWSSTKINTEITNATNSIIFPVTEVNGKQGIVVLVKGDIQLGNVDNTSDLDKPLSTATIIALDGKSDTNHLHTGIYEPADSAIQAHITLADGSNPHATTYLSLSDTPASFVGQAGRVGYVNNTETAIEFEKPKGLFAESKPTGLVDGGELNIVNLGADIEVIAGTGLKIDSYTNPNSSPTYIELSWNTLQEPITNLTPLAGDVIYITIADGGVAGPVVDTNLGVIQQFVTQPSPSVVRDVIYLGYILYNGSDWGEISAPIVVNNSAVSLAEWMKTIGGPSWVHSGGKTTETSVFSLSRTSGIVWELNRNWHINKKDPHRESFNEALDFSFRYTNRDFTTVSALTNVIDPSLWDNNGIVEAVPGFNAVTAIQRVYIDQRNNYWIMYGQNLNDNFREAVARIGIDDANTITPTLLDASIFLGYIIAENNIITWTEEKARFVSATEASSGGSGSASIDAFINLIDTPISYVGSAGDMLMVNATEDGIVFNTFNTGIGSFVNTSNTIHDSSGTGGDVITTAIENGTYGLNAGQYLSTGNSNIAIGTRALQGNITDTVTGSFNVTLGYESGLALTSGSENVLIGRIAGSTLTTQSNQLVIGNVNGSLITGDFLTKEVQVQGELTTKVVTFDGLFDYGSIGGTFTLNYVNGQYQKVTLTASGTLSITPPSINKPCTFYLHIHQDATGGRVLTLPLGKWINGIAKPNTLTANAHDLLMVHYYGGTNYVYEMMLNLS